ncbi:E3 ubiquitin ligase BIG BROTHER-related-like [Impatiens glandulifera]|uniref:E3 ubiquitin ligase BIG BROTHER-related-like n=1 Tax=Impatiens glandulifera TaxID=253017 RepID=UPI001FB12128|nr:E3 ubiquitin ligase BIG BROTHER-related-like [Impatiens glandulifera]
MPEVSYLHLHDEDDNEDDTPENIANLHSTPLWSSWNEDLDLYSTDPEFTTIDFSVSSHLQSVRGQSSGFIQFLDEYPDTSPNINNDLFDRENQVNFVMDLFHQRVEQSTIVGTNLLPMGPNLDTILYEFDRNDEMGLSNLDLDLDLGLELMLFADRNENQNCPVMAADTECSGSGISGLRVVGIESDSEQEEEGDNEVVGDDRNAEDYYGLDGEGDDIRNLLLRWTSFQFEEDFDWAEVDDRSREVLSLFLDPDLDEDLDAVPRHQNMSIGAVRNSQWEVLSNIQNFESNMNPEHYNEYTADEYELLFGQFAENENTVMGKPPASRTVIENLPSVILTQLDLCAVCKDEINIDGEAKQLPCNHHYHSDCIIPWLGIRNTCPVCRHELPTDDLDYEMRKTRRIGNAH